MIAPDALWEKLATFGALGIIVAWLLFERWVMAAKERRARHDLADAITANTLATQLLVDKIKDLNRAIWQFIITGGGKHHEDRDKDQSRND